MTTKTRAASLKRKEPFTLMEHGTIEERTRFGEHVLQPRRTYSLILLTIAYLLNWFDRSIVNVLLDAIKSDLQLSDTALGFIAGIGFALLYTLLGLPLARLADVRGRRGVVAAGVALWSLMTAVGGWARTGTELALARAGVGIGEAAGTSPSMAMLGDLFSKQESPRALSILVIGMPLGIFAGILFGGLASQAIGWRGALMIAGLPGLVLALLIQFTIPEPHSPHAAPARAKEKADPLGVTLRFMVGQRSFLCCIGGAFFSGFALNALFTWTPLFYTRVHGLSAGQVGIWVGCLLGIGGAIGAFSGGAIVTRFAGHDDRWKFIQPVIACLTALPFLLGMLFASSLTISLIGLGFGSALMLSLLGPMFSVYPLVTRPRMRALATAVHNLAGTLGGLGLGALMVGILSDHLTPIYGRGAIRYALLLPIGCLLPAAILYALGTKWICQDAARAEMIN